MGRAPRGLVVVAVVTAAAQGGPPPTSCRRCISAPNTCQWSRPSSPASTDSSARASSTSAGSCRSCGYSHRVHASVEHGTTILSEKARSRLTMPSDPYVHAQRTMASVVGTIRAGRDPFAHL